MMNLTLDQISSITKKRWMILIFSCLINLCIGSMYAWSSLSAPMAQELNANLSSVFSVANAVSFITMPRVAQVSLIRVLNTIQMLLKRLTTKNINTLFIPHIIPTMKVIITLRAILSQSSEKTADGFLIRNSIPAVQK